MNLIINFYAILLTALSINPSFGHFLNILHHQLATHAVDRATTITAPNAASVDYKPYPYKQTSYKPYQAQAQAAEVYDLDSAQILYQKNPQGRLPIASITKLATALVIMQRHRMDETVTIPTGIKLPPESEVIGLTTG